MSMPGSWGASVVVASVWGVASWGASGCAGLKRGSLTVSMPGSSGASAAGASGVSTAPSCGQESVTAGNDASAPRSAEGRATASSGNIVKNSVLSPGRSPCSTVSSSWVLSSGRPRSSKVSRICVLSAGESSSPKVVRSSVRSPCMGTSACACVAAAPPSAPDSANPGWGATYGWPWGAGNPGLSENMLMSVVTDWSGAPAGCTGWP